LHLLTGFRNASAFQVEILGFLAYVFTINVDLSPVKAAMLMKTTMMMMLIRVMNDKNNEDDYNVCDDTACDVHGSCLTFTA